MAVIKPFKALRPAKDKVSLVSSLPYDVISNDEVKKEISNNPYTFLQVEKSMVTDANITNPYLEAAENLKRMEKDGILIEDKTPCMYIYRLSSKGHEQTGLAACVTVSDYENGIIKKHELTISEKQLDRENQIKACMAHTSPIFITYPQMNEIDKKIDEITKSQPEYEFISNDGVKHTFWVINNKETIDQLSDMFLNVSSLYIADGHHRNAAAVNVAKQFKNNTGAQVYPCVLFPDNQLNILSYNRAVSDINGLSSDEFIEKVSQHFYIMPYNGQGPFAPFMPHQFGMYFEQKWYLLTAQEDAIADDPVGRLDVSILQNRLLGPILGIQDPRTDKRIDFVGGIRGLGELEKRVILSEGKIAFSLYPTSMEELMNVADQGLIMPPKSTWFEPKLRSGLFIHVLSDH